MSTKEIKNLIELAKKLKKEVSKESALNTFIGAGILDKNGEFTEPYKNLNSFFINKAS
jgi:hypothetical protein